MCDAWLEVRRVPAAGAAPGLAHTFRAVTRREWLARMLRGVRQPHCMRDARSGV